MVIIEILRCSGEFLDTAGGLVNLEIPLMNSFRRSSFRLVMMVFVVVSFLVGVVEGGGVPGGSGIPGVTITEFTVPNAWSKVKAINNAGQIAGERQLIKNSHDEAFLWDGGSLTMLGDLGFGMSRSHGISENGLVVGYSVNEQVQSEAFFWNGKVMQSLNPSWSTNSRALGVNDAGQVVLQVWNGSINEGFLWEDGVFTPLGQLFQDGSYPVAINNAGQVVGSSWDYSVPPSGVMEAFLWEDGMMIGLGKLGGRQSQAVDINDAGQVAMWIRHHDWTPQAFVWDQGTIITLETPEGMGSSTRGLNNLSQVVGSIHTGAQAINGDAVIWENGVMILLYDLLDPTTDGIVWDSLNYAQDINDQGQIIGQGIIDGIGHPFLMTIPSPCQRADISPAGTATTPPGNGVINIEDLVAVLNAFGPCADCDEDFTPLGGNGIVNIDDLVALLNAFGPCS